MLAGSCISSAVRKYQNETPKVARKAFNMKGVWNPVCSHQQVAQHKRNMIALFGNCTFLSFLRKSETNLKASVLKYDECKQVLETFQNGKSRGEDGFTVEQFYKFL